VIRKAHMRDVPVIHALINEYAQEELMLPVSRVELYDRLRDFFVYEQDGRLVGTMAIHFTWDGLAELRSLAVVRDRQHQGIGRTLVEAGLREARDYDCARVFTLTYVPDFFERLGFRRIDKNELPHKVWADCIKCPKFPDCGEVPLAHDFGEEDA